MLLVPGSQLVGGGARIPGVVRPAPLCCLLRLRLWFLVPDILILVPESCPQLPVLWRAATRGRFLLSVLWARFLRVECVLEGWPSLIWVCPVPQPHPRREPGSQMPPLLRATSGSLLIKNGNSDSHL